jgi:hypothetical protein
LYQAHARFPAFLHDELLSELDVELAHLAGERISEVMMSAFRKWIPDVYGKCDPTLMYAWSKSADEVRDEYGKLLVWEPKK